jgi:lipoate-protein ligase A
MHGEYKTPGGKMVVADFEVREGRLADVQISGDFFLYPETALKEINNALNGASVDSDLATIVAISLSPGIEMLGFTPEAVAEAVRRGLLG